MLNSDIKEAKVASKPEFPCLKVFRDCSGVMVVLFTGHGVGTVVHSTRPYNSLGSYSENWVSENWEPFNGQIVLENA